MRWWSSSCAASEFINLEVPLIEKPAQTRVPIHDPARRRFSPRAFSSQPVAVETIVSLLEAARWAPSGGNRQPWRFIFVTRQEPEAFARLLECLDEGNQRWAKDVPLLVLTIAQVQDSRGGNTYAFHDVGLATMNLILQAMSLDLFVHPMAGFSAERARQAFHIPEGYAPVTTLAIGYRGDPAQLPPDLEERERRLRERKPLEEIVFGEGWGSSPAWLKGEKGNP
jgi:nitroreductase